MGDTWWPAGWWRRLRVWVWRVDCGRVGTAVLLHDWRHVFRVSGGVTPTGPVWVVRRDWPDGTHELVAPRRDSGAAERALLADAWFWRGGPVRPRLSLVATTLVEFRSHPAGRRWCRRATCPTAGSVLVPGAGG